MAAATSRGLVKQSKVFLLFVCLLALISTGCAISRKLVMKNFTCPETIAQCKDNNITLVYVSAESKHHDNIVHFLWTTYGGPTIITAYSSKLQKDHQEPELNIAWEKLFGKNPEGAIKFIPAPHYTSAFSITSVLVYNDPKDKIYFTETGTKLYTHDLSNIEWNEVEIEEKQHSAVFTGNFLGGSISFKCWAGDHDDRDTTPPRQRYSSNVTRFTFALDQLTTNLSLTDRLALEIISIAKTQSKQNTCATEYESIDDEYSPAIFRTLVMNSTDGKEVSFVAWKPVIYNKEKRGLQTQLPSYSYLYHNGKYHQEKIPSSKCTNLVSGTNKPSAIVIAAMDKELLVYPLTMSYGQQKDGCYLGTKFMSWSGQAGYGMPLFDEISKTVLITIIAGLGIPVLIILVGSVYVCVKKFKESKTTSSYGRIN